MTKSRAMKKYKAPSIVVLCLTLVLTVFKNCGGGGGGSTGKSSSSSESGDGQCSPTISVGGSNYNSQLCLDNRQVQAYCMNLRSTCRDVCWDDQRERIANGVQGTTYLNS